MTTENLIAEASINIKAPAAKVWDAFVNPSVIKQYMMGADVKSDWKKGSSITWSGEIEGKPYKDEGEILDIIPEKRLEYSHTAGSNPSETHKVTVILDEKDGGTQVKLMQDNNANTKAKDAHQKNWNMMLESLKKLLE